MTVSRFLALAAVAALTLAGCSASPTADAPPPETPPANTAADSLLAAYDLAGLDGKEIVELLDRTPVAERPAGLGASVRADELLLSDAGSDEPVAVELPGDEFYLSVAPYVETTHECHFHNLTGCRGELSGETLAVRITDRDSGAVLVDETTDTFDNGFVGFWLPSGINATIEVEYGGRSGSQDIATGPEDPTCLTTLALA